jgi:hypothetical protein
VKLAAEYSALYQGTNLVMPQLLENTIGLEGV